MYSFSYLLVLVNLESNHNVGKLTQHLSITIYLVAIELNLASWELALSCRSFGESREEMGVRIFDFRFRTIAKFT